MREDKAIELYEDFYARNWSEIFELDYTWPEQAVEMGEATAIAYSSDKWNEGKWVDYIHHHKSPLPKLYGQPKAGEASVKLKTPSGMLAILGYALELEYKAKDGKIYHIDWERTPSGSKRKRSDLPLLASARKGLLVVIPKSGKDTLVIKGGKMHVTSRGIEL